MMTIASRSIFVLGYSILSSLGVGCSWVDLELPKPTGLLDVNAEESDSDADEPDADEDAQNELDALDAPDSEDSNAENDRCESGECEDDSGTDREEQTPDGFVSCEEDGCDRYLVGGPYSDFDTIGEAVDKISQDEIFTCVLFCIAPGVYQEQVTIKPIEGASKDNAVIFRGIATSPEGVKVVHSANSSKDDWVVRLDDADHVTLENMTIESEGIEFGTVLVLENSASYNTIRDLLLKNSAQTLSVLVQVLDANTQNTLINNRFEGGGTGIRFWSLGWNVTDTRVSDNEFIDQMNSALDVQRADGIRIVNNRIIAQTVSPGYRAIYLANCASGWKVERNTVSIPSGRGLSVEYCTGSSELPNTVANNCVRVQGQTGAAFNTAFEMRNVVNLWVVHNTFVVGRRAGSNSVAFHLATSGEGSGSCIAKNNLFANMSRGHALQFDNDEGLTECDYNDLYTTGSVLGIHGTSKTSARNLIGWQTELGIDKNSVSVDPLFTSDTDCRIAADRLDGAATPIPSIEIDLEGDQRDEQHPDIGADEFE